MVPIKMPFDFPQGQDSTLLDSPQDYRGLLEIQLGCLGPTISVPLFEPVIVSPIHIRCFISELVRLDHLHINLGRTIEVFWAEDVMGLVKYCGGLIIARNFWIRERLCYLTKSTRALHVCVIMGRGCPWKLRCERIRTFKLLLGYRLYRRTWDVCELER